MSNFCSISFFSFARNFKVIVYKYSEFKELKRWLKNYRIRTESIHERQSAVTR